MNSIRKAAFGTALACVLFCGSAQAGDFGLGGFWSWFSFLSGANTEQGIGTPSWVIFKSGNDGSGAKSGNDGSGAKSGNDGSGKN